MGLEAMLSHSFTDQAGAAIPRVIVAFPVLDGGWVNGVLHREMATRRRFEPVSPVQ